ncbi:MAG: hypothetical protein JNM24_16185 [Bdellovibrionaceae bacterium]|nr:hypothetical protein [Pseudobdellovibrionaceae bacterium]
MSKTIVFYFQSLVLIWIGFLLKYLSLSMYAATSNYHSQQRFIDSMCEKDILHVEPICQIKSNANLYFESGLLGKAAILIGMVSITFLIYNQIKKLYPTKFSYVAISLNVVLLLYSGLVWI